MLKFLIFSRYFTFTKKYLTENLSLRVESVLLTPNKSLLKELFIHLEVQMMFQFKWLGKHIAEINSIHWNTYNINIQGLTKIFHSKMFFSGFPNQKEDKFTSCIFYHSICFSLIFIISSQNLLLHFFLPSTKPCLF